MDNSFRIISPKSFSSSKLILSRSKLRIPVLLARNVTLLKSSSIKSISSLDSKASWNFLRILFVTNQSGIDFNGSRQSLTSSLYTFWVLYILGQYININDLWKQLCHTFLESHDDDDDDDDDELSLWYGWPTKWF